MRLSITVFAVAAALVAVASAADVGDRVRMSAYLGTELPLTAAAAEQEGWSKVGGCDPKQGITYHFKEGKSHPGLLFFTSAGQIAGVGVIHYDAPPAPTVSGGYWMPHTPGIYDNGKEYYATLTFRDQSLMCSGAHDTAHVLGDRVIFNAKTVALEVPMTAGEAGDWYHGGCIKGMGYHYSQDIQGKAKMSWDATKQVPITPMYHPVTREIQAVLFSTPETQRGKPFGPWEGPFINSLFNFNYCPDAKWQHHHLWSTLHFFFKDTSSLTCPNRCE